MKRMSALQRKYFGKKHGRKTAGVKKQGKARRHAAKRAASSAPVRVANRTGQRGSTSLSVLGMFLSLFAGVGGGYFIPELIVEKTIPTKSNGVKAAVEIVLGVIPGAGLIYWGGPTVKVAGASLIVGDMLQVTKKQVKKAIAERAGLKGLGYDIYQVDAGEPYGYLAAGIPSPDAVRTSLLAGQL